MVQAMSEYPDVFDVKKAFPEMFVQRPLGTEVPIGWTSLVTALFSIVKHENEVQVARGHEPVLVKQVKEKFGSLRVYVTHRNDFVSGMIAMAETISGLTCQVTGDIGRGRQIGGLVITLSDAEVEKARARGEEVEDWWLP